MEIVDTKLSDYVFELKKYYEKLLLMYLDCKPKADIPSMSRFLMKMVLQLEMK